MTSSASNGVPDYDVLANHTLRVRAAELSDAGVYVCVAQNQAGTTLHHVRLDVLGKLCLISTFKKYISVFNFGVFSRVCYLSANVASYTCRKRHKRGWMFDELVNKCTNIWVLSICYLSGQIREDSKK